MGPDNVATGATVQLNALLLTPAGVGASGLSPTVKVRRASDNKLLDWSDSTFKSSGWTTLAQAMTQVDSVNDPGAYTVNLNLGAIVSPVADDLYTWTTTATGASAPFIGQIRVSTVVDRVDAAISTLATPANITSAQTAINAHTDSAVAPLATSAGVTSATSPLATSSALSTAQTDLTAIKGTGFTGGVDDLHSAHALLAGAATGAALTSAISTIDGHTDSAVAPLSTAAALAQVFAALAAAAPTVVAGGSSSVVRSTATQADGFYSGMSLVVVNAAGVTSRRISSYAHTNGAFTLDSALPFTPTGGDQLFVLAALAPATSVDVTAVNAHTDTAVAPLATTAQLGPLATSSDVSASTTAVNTHVDSATAPLATTSGLAAAVSTVGAAIAASQTAVNAHTDSATAPLATSSALTTAQAALTAIQGSGFTGGVDDLHSAHALLAATATASGLVSAVAPLATATSIAQLLAILAAAMPTVVAGGSASVVHSTATQASGFFDQMVLVAINAAGVAARRVTSYAQTNGAFTLDSALPFTPSAADQLYVLAQPAPAEAGDAMTLTSGERAAVAGAVTGAGVALTTDVTSAVSSVNTHTDDATSPLATAAGLTSATSPLATSAALTTAQGDLTAIKGTGFTGGTDDLHAAHALLAGAATGGGLSSAVTSVNAHTDGAVAPLATSAELTAAISAIVMGVIQASIAGAPPGSLGAELLTTRKYNNKKALVKVGSVWELHIFDDDGSTLWLALPLKDFLGNNVVPAPLEPGRIG